MSAEVRPDDPRALLRALEQRARKRFGQHFLADQGVVDRIVRSARLPTGAKVVEIGPGLGILTRALLAAGADLTAIELDRDLAAHLRATFPDLHLVEGDAARVDWDTVCPGPDRWHVVANLPYNVGTHLTTALVRKPARFAAITVMLQREVVDRLCAEPGSRTYGALSVEIQARARTRFVLAVPPSKFHPAPKVHSAVVRLEPLPEPDVGPAGPDVFDAVVRTAFSQRRKALANALAARYGRDRARAVVESLGLPPLVRAEALDVATFRTLAAALAGDGSEPPGDDPDPDRRYSLKER